MDFCSVDLSVCLPSILYFTCLNRFCACFLPVPLIPRCSNPNVSSTWTFDLVLFLLTVLLHVLIGLSYISAVLIIFMPIKGFFEYGHDLMQTKKYVSSSD